MIVIYIIGGLFALILAVYFLDKREKMTHEIKEIMGSMGINSIEALKGNRLMLRGIGLNEKELSILGISHAGE